MNLDESKLSSEELHLYRTLASLKDKLDGMTSEQYRRVNPFAENICDWHAKGERYGAEGVVMNDSATIIGDVTMGPYCWVGPGCLLDGSGRLSIGHHVIFASGVQVYTHDTVKWALSGGLAEYEHTPVTIGDCVFISTGSIVVRGVTIGDHALVCANATVVADVAPYTIVAGTPARPIGRVVVDGADVRLEYFHGRKAVDDAPAAGDVPMADPASADDVPTAGKMPASERGNA